MAGLESSLESWLRVECKNRGWLCIKLTIQTGIPDRLIVADGGRCFFVELKTPSGKRTPIQKWWARKLEALGFNYLCTDSREVLEAAIQWTEREK